MTQAQPTTELPIAMHEGRRFEVAAECGDGFTVTIELHDEAEVEAVIAALKARKELSNG